jgi:hypothetical protein
MLHGFFWDIITSKKMNKHIEKKYFRMVTIEERNASGYFTLVRNMVYFELLIDIKVFMWKK